MSIRSALRGPSRKATASMIPVRGAPVGPSKKATRQPFSSQWTLSAALLAASAARAFAKVLIVRRVLQAFSAAMLRFAINGIVSPQVSKIRLIRTESMDANPIPGRQQATHGYIRVVNVGYNQAMRTKVSKALSYSVHYEEAKEGGYF